MDSSVSIVFDDSGRLLSRQAYIQKQMAAYCPKHAPDTPEYAGELDRQAMLAAYQYKTGVIDALMCGEIDPRAAHQALGDDYLPAINLSLLGVCNKMTALSGDGRWLTRQEFMRSLAAHPLEELIPNPDNRARVLAEIEFEYACKVRRALRDGEMDYQTGLVLIGENEARFGMQQYYDQRLTSLSPGEYISGVKPFRPYATASELHFEHYTRVNKALEEKKQVADCALDGYPDLARRFTPWRFDKDAWVEAEEEALFKPVLIGVKRFVWQNRRYGYREDHTGNRDEAERYRRQAKRQQPGCQWDVEATLGDLSLFVVIGRLYSPAKLKPRQKVPPETCQSLAEQHRDAVIEALKNGLPVPPDVLIGYPDLIATFGW